MLRGLESEMKFSMLRKKGDWGLAPPPSLKTTTCINYSTVASVFALGRTLMSLM